MSISPIERRNDDETTTEQVRGAIPRVGVNRSSEAGPSQGGVRTNGEAQNGAPQAQSSQNTVTAESNGQNTEPYVLPSYVEQQLDMACLRADLKRHETEALRRSEQIVALERETRELRERLATAVETQQNNVVRINPNGMNEGSGGSDLQEQRNTWAQQTPRGLPKGTNTQRNGIRIATDGSHNGVDILKKEAHQAGDGVMRIDTHNKE
eukprot:g2417.t1